MSKSPKECHTVRTWHKGTSVMDEHLSLAKSHHGDAFLSFASKSPPALALPSNILAQKCT